MKPFIANLGKILANLDHFKGPGAPRPKTVFKRRRQVRLVTDRYRAQLQMAENRRQEPQRTINAMTNHERNLWARGGYPKGKKFKIYAAAAIERLKRAEERRAG